MQWTITDGRPIWQQLTSQLTQAIATGHYPPGGKIPPVRELALETGVNPNTMQRALSQLESDGLVVTNRTAGRTVTENGDILHAMRKNLANTAIKSYFTQMSQLGFTQQEAIAQLAEHAETEGQP